jgi:predicted GNAT superfamily acetyltransferase
MDRYDQVKTQLKKINRDKVSELLNELKSIEIRKLEEVQYANLTKFLKGIDADERVGYLHTILFNYTKDDTKKHPAFLKFVRGFKDDYMAIQKDAVK